MVDKSLSLDIRFNLKGFKSMGWMQNCKCKKNRFQINVCFADTLFHGKMIFKGKLKQRIWVEAGFAVIGGSWFGGRKCREGRKWAALTPPLLPGLESGLVLLELVTPVGIDLELKKNHFFFSSKNSLVEKVTLNNINLQFS